MLLLVLVEVEGQVEIIPAFFVTLLEQSSLNVSFQTVCHSTVVHISFRQSLRSVHAIHLIS